MVLSCFFYFTTERGENLTDEYISSKTLADSLAAMQGSDIRLIYTTAMSGSMGKSFLSPYNRKRG